MDTAACPSGKVPPNLWDGVTGWNWAMMSAADGLQECANAWVGWQQETARFLDMRIAENQRSWTTLLSSRDVAGAMKTQQEWALKTATDYAREATRLAHLVTTLSLTGTTPAVQSAAALMV